ncbi:Metallo-dependent phosphatase-like protein [Abortiporus biennis]
MTMPSQILGQPTASSSSATVYTNYDIKNPPPHPGASWTRFICISDTHSRKYEVPDGDVLLHSGDLSSWGYFHQLSKTMNWLKSLSHPVKVIIAGNHDLCLDDEWRVGGHWDHHKGGAIANKDVDAAQAFMRSEELRDEGFHYLEFEPCTITAPNGRSWEVYGSPAAPRYAYGSFQYTDNKAAQKIYDKIPSTTEILLTHTPPYGTCDWSRKQRHSGCKVLASRLENKNLSKCRLHVFGHIHEAYGAAIKDNHGGRVSVNAAIHDEDLPVIVDLLN